MHPHVVSHLSDVILVVKLVRNLSVLSDLSHIVGLVLPQVILEIDVHVVAIIIQSGCGILNIV